jgi:hypothetical protein
MSHKAIPALVLLSLLLSACGPGQLFGPTTTPTATPTPPATSTPVPTATQPPTPTPTPVVYDGEWSGQTSGNAPVTFGVEGNQVKDFTITFGFGSNRASCSIKFEQGADSFWAIQDSRFDTEGSIAIHGIFEAADTASGSLEATMNVPNCKGTVSLTWTAARK